MTGTKAGTKAAGWDDLARECDAWAAAGRVVELWWRDDDSVEDTAALRRLLELAAGRAPIALAVIPAMLRSSLTDHLGDHLRDRPGDEGNSVSVLQHGYDHGNRAAAGAKKSEFPPERAAAEVSAALAAGRDRLRAAFGNRFVPALTPPWNRFDDRYLSLLPDLGYRGLTTYLPRRNKLAAPGIRQVNTHVDVIDWHGGRGFLGLSPTLDLLVGHLAAKRGGAADATEPTGLLTHHLVHETETWEFLGAFLDWCAGRPGIRWRGAAELFPETILRESGFQDSGFQESGA